jgi:hypothetical protein
LNQHRSILKQRIVASTSLQTEPTRSLHRIPRHRPSHRRRHRCRLTKVSPRSSRKTRLVSTGEMSSSRPCSNASTMNACWWWGDRPGAASRRWYGRVSFPPLEPEVFLVANGGRWLSLPPGHILPLSCHINSQSCLVT